MLPFVLSFEKLKEDVRMIMPIESLGRRSSALRITAEDTNLATFTMLATKTLSMLVLSGMKPMPVL